MDNDRKSEKKNKKDEKPDSEKTDHGWHRWFGNMFKEMLTPLGLEVHTEFFVMTDPPRADVVVIRKPLREWTKEQLMFLPDGIRDSRAAHVLIEFKHTESLDRNTFCKSLGYWIFYKLHHKLEDHEVQSFLVSSKTPAVKTLSRYGYTQTRHAGIFESSDEFADLITVISLNDLADVHYNAFVSLFGSKKKAKLRALKRLLAMIPDIDALIPARLKIFISRIANFLLKKGGNEMELTPEERKDIQDIFNRWIFPNLTLDEVLSKFSDDKVLSRYSQDDLVKRIDPEYMEAYLKSLKKNQ